MFAPSVLPTGILTELSDVKDGDSLVWSNSKGRFINSPAPPATVVTDSTLDGDGSPSDPLGLQVSGVVAGTYTNMSANIDPFGRIVSAINGATPLTSVAHDATLSGAGTIGSPLAVVPGSISVISDNVTVEGDGTLLTPIKLKAIQTTSDMTGDGTIVSQLQLSNTTVVAGSYTNTDLLVDGKGRILSATSGIAGLTSVSTTSNLTGDGTGGSPLDLSATGVTPNTYINPKIVVDGFGRITDAADGSSGLTSVSTTSNFTGDGTPGLPLNLSDTTVVAGSYTLANITVNSKGRLTAASNGTALTSVTTTANLSGAGTVGSPLDLANAGTAGTYVTPQSITTDTKGRISSITAKSAASVTLLSFKGNMTIPTAAIGTFTTANFLTPSGGFNNQIPSSLNTTTGTYTTPQTGWYQCNLTGVWDANATGIRSIQILTNGSFGAQAFAGATFTSVTATTSATHCCSGLIAVNAGDTIVFQGNQSSGANRILTIFASIYFLGLQ